MYTLVFVFISIVFIEFWSFEMKFEVIWRLGEKGWKNILGELENIFIEKTIVSINYCD